MNTRHATHAEAVYIARALNLNIESVWEAIRNMPFSSYADLELAVHRHFARHKKAAMDRDHSLTSV
jgi:hypothetical protein